MGGRAGEDAGELVREGPGGEWWRHRMTGRGRVSSRWEGSARCERVSAHRGAGEQECVKEGGEQEAEAALKLLGGGEHERSLPGGREATESLGSGVWASEAAPVPPTRRRSGLGCWASTRAGDT